MTANFALHTSAFLRAVAFGAAVLLSANTVDAAATITILNTDAAGVGFNDPTPVAPIGGNPGTTLGQQRLNAFQRAAEIWGAQLNSVPTIVIDAAWAALSCTANTATLGSAGATQVFTSVTFPIPNTWYPVALANKLFGAQIDPTVPEIRARFNVNLGQPGCLTGVFFYLGLDNNHGPNVDLVTTLLHEFAHGLGFQAFTQQNGSLLGPPFLPSVFNRFQLDNQTNKMWDVMTNAERAASSINTRRVVWTGANVSGSVNSVLFPGTPRLLVNAPFSLADAYLVGLATFGSPLSSPGVSGEVMPLSGVGNQLLGCDPFSALNVAAVVGKIALIDRGGVCGFTTKVKNAQDAGAIGVLIGNNAAGSPPPGMGGADPAITIPAAMITQADTARFRDFLRFRSRTHSGMFVTLGVDPNQRQGADPAGRVMLYTPNPFMPGFSVSHWDTSAFANLLMELPRTEDLTHNVSAPFDLTLEFLRDIGW